MMSSYVKVALPEIKLARTQRKLDRAIKQREYWKARCAHYKEVLDLSPQVERRHAAFLKERAERQHVKDLEARINEQALLITKLVSITLASSIP